MAEATSTKRAKPSSGTDLLELSEKTCVELGEILGLTPEDPNAEPSPTYRSMLSDVRFELTGYANLVEWLDTGPRPTAVAASVRQLEMATKELASVIDTLVPEAESVVNIQRFCLFDRNGLPPASLNMVARDLGKYLLPACAAALEQCAGLGESRGRPRREALRVLLRRLTEIFDQYFVEDQQQTAEPVTFLRVEFLEVACGAAGIKLPRGKNAPSEILRLARPSRKNRL